ncbi:Ribokinase [Rubellimicrobium mesophilum DSM 19309]|uniref:Ribokinase n=1 Tax=Rubellimicrobium mesophilum DSM 19309 TaxID=442562 RepID=A0A017HQW9_9RHOB|nr:PfkB family carbohydrate kinase [Rubellimicrobium mesophilum]EYD76144.1 Ribokinase [Rubellimicrobium mesophilum DSM 19309]
MSQPANGVLVVGSLHYDIMVAAPHRPVAGETVQGERWFPKFGGKGGNQAVAAARAGAPVRMLGAVGDDAFGAFLREGLSRGGVDDRWVATLPGEGSGMSVAVSDASGDYGAVIVSGANLRIDPARLEDDGLWAGMGLLMLQNEVSEALNLAAARAARARGVRVCLNAAPYRPLHPGLVGALDILIANALEAEALSKRAVAGLDQAEEAAERLARAVPIVVVTAGGDGVAVAESRSGSFALPAERVTPVSTHGAGDLFAGALAAALMDGAPLREAVERANRAAARHVAGLG